jgi:tetratricopeptide (TPR) repeat protein
MAQMRSTQTTTPPPSERGIPDTNTGDTVGMQTSAEDADFRGFESMNASKLDKKIQAGESFLKKYKDSRYRGQVYSELTLLYIRANRTDQALTTGEKAVQANPNDVLTMGVLSETMARMANPGTPDAAEKLEQAEKYGQEAVTVAPTVKKPDGVKEEAFNAQKNEALAMAYSGLGLVDVRQGKYAEAIPNLQQAVQLDAKKDPTNFYLLGVANQNTSHYAEAAAAFRQCAEAPGNLQATCKSAGDEAEKKAGI